MERAFITICKHFLRLGLLMLTLFLAYSCANDEKELTDPNTPSYVTNAKTWLLENHPNITFSSYWNKAKRQQVKDLTIVDVPLVCAPGEYGANPADVLEGREERYWDHPVRLEFVINNGGVVTSALIYTIVPTLPYMEKHDFKYDEITYLQPKDLDGVIYSYGLYGQPLRMDQFTNGELKGSYLPLSREQVDKLAKMFPKRMGGGDDIPEWGWPGDDKAKICPYCAADKNICGCKGSGSGGNQGTPGGNSGIIYPYCTHCGVRDCGGVCLSWCDYCGPYLHNCDCDGNGNIIRCSNCHTRDCGGNCTTQICIWCGVLITRCGCDIPG